MNSRERVIAAINHIEPDRVPIDLGGTAVSGIHIDPYKNLLNYLGIKKGKIPKIFDIEQMLVWVEEPIIRRFKVDVVYVPKMVQMLGMRINSWRKWKLKNGNQVEVPGNFYPVKNGNDGTLYLYVDGELVAKKVPGSPYFDRMIEFKVHEPLLPVESFNLELYTDEELDWCYDWAEKLRSDTDKAVIGGFDLILGRWGSYQEWMLTIAANPEYVKQWYEYKLENLLANVKLYYQAVGENIDIIFLGEDFGMQQGMILSPRSFNEIVAPYYKKFFSWIRTHTHWKILFHCDGGIYPIINTLIDCGVDILNPVQTSAVGMNPKRLKRDFGDKITFWGGSVEPQTVLPGDDVDQIRAQVKERIREFGRDGGYVFAPIHNIQPDVRPENIVAMFDSALDYGKYPLV